MSCENDFECDDRRSCLLVNSTFKECICSPFEGYTGDDCTDFTLPHLLYYFLLAIPKLLIQCMLLYKVLFKDNANYVEAKLKRYSSTAISRNLLIVGIILFIMSSVTEIAVYFTPEGYVGTNVVFFNRRQDVRTLLPFYIVSPVVAIAIYLNCQIALVWIENAKRLEALDPTLNSRISQKIKKIYIVYFISGVVILALLSGLGARFMIPVLYPLYCFVVVVFVHRYCAKEFLTSLQMFSEAYVDSTPYKMVQRLSLTVIIAFGFILVGAIWDFAEIIFIDFFEGLKPFPAGTNPIQLILLGTFLNIYGLAMYISSSVSGKALFQANQSRRIKDYSSSTIGIKQPIGTYQYEAKL